MKLVISIITLGVLSGCGVNISSDPIRVDPISVVHTINLNFENISNYCATSCLNNLDSTKCSSDCYTNFMNIFSVAVQPTPTPAGN